MKRLLAIIAFLLAALTVYAADTTAAAPLLPRSFGGWEKSVSNVSDDPAAADATAAPLLKEYGFSTVESATYSRPGRQMTVKAARFADATGAYGAFTFYKSPEMLNEKFGDQGAALNDHILFYRGNVLVQATLDRITAMSAGELRELAEGIPLPSGTARNLPTLPQYLPKQAYVKNSAKYLVGPIGIATVGAPVPADAVDFNRNAEVAEGKYSTSRGTATLMLISYPTPQIAGERLRAIEALGQNAPPQSDATMAPPFTAKRTGPIVALVAGEITGDEAKSLLASVNYDADVTWNQNTYFDKKNNVANLLVNIVFLIGIILVFAIVVGVAFGGVRIIVKRLYPGRVFDRSEDMEIIQLRLGK